MMFKRDHIGILHTCSRNHPRSLSEHMLPITLRATGFFPVPTQMVIISTGSMPRLAQHVCFIWTAFSDPLSAHTTQLHYTGMIFFTAFTLISYSSSTTMKSCVFSDSSILFDTFKPCQSRHACMCFDGIRAITTVATKAQIVVISKLSTATLVPMSPDNSIFFAITNYAGRALTRTTVPKIICHSQIEVKYS